MCWTYGLSTLSSPHTKSRGANCGCKQSHPFPVAQLPPNSTPEVFPESPRKQTMACAAFRQGSVTAAPVLSCWGCLVWLGRMQPAHGRHLLLKSLSQTHCFPASSPEHQWEGVPCSQAPCFVPCCLVLAAATRLTPIQNPRLVSPPPPRAFLSGFIVISHSRQRRDGGRGGGVLLGASSHNLCLTNLPARGLRGAPPTPASPHPSSIPLALCTLRRMAGSGGGGRERD